MIVEIKEGCVVEVDDEAMDNMELIEAIAETKNDSAAGLSKVLTLILGKEQKKKLYDDLRNEKGRVPVAAVSDAIIKIMNGFGDKGKNS